MHFLQHPTGSAVSLDLDIILMSPLRLSVILSVEDSQPPSTKAPDTGEEIEVTLPVLSLAPCDCGL